MKEVLTLPQTGEPERQWSELFCPGPSHQPECRWCPGCRGWLASSSPENQQPNTSSRRQYHPLLTRSNSGLPIYFSSPQLCASSIPKTWQYHNTRIKIKTCKTATDKKKKKWQMEHNVGKTVSFFHNQNLHSIFVVVLTYLLLHTKYILSHTTHPPCVFHSLNCGRKLF